LSAQVAGVAHPGKPDYQPLLTGREANQQDSIIRVGAELAQTPWQENAAQPA